MAFVGGFRGVQRGRNAENSRKLDRNRQKKGLLSFQFSGPVRIYYILIYKSCVVRAVLQTAS